MITIADKLIAEGKAEGMEKGKAEGMEKGKAEGMEKGKAEGMEEGMEKGKAEVALNLLKQGISIEVISKSTGLSEREIEKLVQK